MEQNIYSENPTVEFIKIAVAFPIFKYKRKESNTYFIVPFPRDLYLSTVLQRRLNGKDPLPILSDAGCGEIPIFTLEAYRYFLRFRKKYYTSD